MAVPTQDAVGRRDLDGAEVDVGVPFRFFGAHSLIATWPWRHCGHRFAGPGIRPCGLNSVRDTSSRYAGVGGITEESGPHHCSMPPAGWSAGANRAGCPRPSAPARGHAPGLGPEPCRVEAAAVRRRQSDRHQRCAQAILPLPRPARSGAGFPCATNCERHGSRDVCARVDSAPSRSVSEHCGRAPDCALSASADRPCRGGVSRWTPRRPCPRDRPRAPQEPNSSHIRCPSATRRAKLSADISPFTYVSPAAMKSIARMPLYWHMPHGMHTVSAGVWQRLVWYRKPPGCRTRHAGSGASPLTERFSRPCGGFPPIVLAVAGCCSRPRLRRSRAATESSGMAETE